MAQAMDSETPSPTCPALSGAKSTPVPEKAGFVAINYISCKPSYAARFECMFCTRARAIDRMPGFLGMQVLRSHQDGEPYLIVSQWTDEASFKAWVGSPEFLEGHKRGFEDVRAAKEKGEEPPMTSRFLTYTVVTE